MSIWFIFNNNNPKILSLHDHTTVIFEESGLLPQLEGFLLILKTAQIRFFSCCLSTSGLICLFVFIWKASAKTNQGKKKNWLSLKQSWWKMFCSACQTLLHSFCYKALLLFEQSQKIWQGGYSDVMVCFLPSLKKFAQCNFFFLRVFL